MDITLVARFEQESARINRGLIWPWIAPLPFDSPLISQRDVDAIPRWFHATRARAQIFPRIFFPHQLIDRQLTRARPVRFDCNSPLIVRCCFSLGLAWLFRAVISS